jgi:hypothetical protein
VEEPHEQRAGREEDERRDDRRRHHPPAYGPLRLCIEFLGLFEERHQRNLRTHTDQQEQQQLRHQPGIDCREIH